MIPQKRFIPNPNKILENPSKISVLEEKFVNQGLEDNNYKDLNEQKERYKGRMISMSDTFYKKLNDYLKRHPTEGNRSSFVVRVVAEYIEKKL